MLFAGITVQTLRLAVAFRIIRQAIVAQAGALPIAVLTASSARTHGRWRGLSWQRPRRVVIKCASCMRGSGADERIHYGAHSERGRRGLHWVSRLVSQQRCALSTFLPGTCGAGAMHLWQAIAKSASV